MKKQSFIDYIKYLYWGGYKSLTPKMIWLTIILKRCGAGLIVRKGVRINKPKLVSLGKYVCLDRYVSIFINKISEITPNVIIGDNVLIGGFSSIGCSNSIVIEDNVILAPHVHITDRNHSYEDVQTPIRKQPAVSPGPVIIGKGSWLGYGSQVMPNVKIGKHCVVAAGSVVTRDIPDYCVVVGIPARVIKRYNENTESWERV